MRLAAKLATALVTGITLVLALQATLQVRTIARLQQEDLGDDVRVLGGMLAAACAPLWASGGRVQADALVRAADSRRPHTHVALRAAGPADVTLPDEGRAGTTRRDGAMHVLARVPVRVDGAVVAVVHVDRQLPAERDYFEAAVTSQISTTAAAVLVCAIVTLALGFLLVGRPLRTLSGLAHRLALGDFSHPVQMRRRDELGSLANDLDRLAERLQQSQARERSERRARTTALEQLRHADRLSTVGKLASSIAHELGTPLNVVSGRAAMIAADTGVSADALHHTQVIIEQCTRMTGIIRELLNLSRRKPVVRRQTRVGDVLSQAAMLMEPVCEEAGITLRIRGDHDASAQIDEGKTLQVLTNLIMNAVQAMPRGGEITLTAEHQRVETPPDPHACSGDYVRVDVEDQGVGIAPERISKIFEPFDTSRRDGGGTGLGLSVCHGIVREHGGFFDVDSEVGRGSRFSVYFPEREVAA